MIKVLQSEITWPSLKGFTGERFHLCCPAIEFQLRSYFDGQLFGIGMMQNRLLIHMNGLFILAALEIARGERFAKTQIAIELQGQRFKDLDRFLGSIIKEACVSTI